MKRFLILYLLFVSAAQVGKGQSFNDREKYKTLLANAKADTTRVMALTDLSHCYATSYPDTAFTYATEALNLSRNIGYKKGESFCLNVIGTFYDARGNYPKSIEVCLEALAIAEKIGAKREVAMAANSLAYTYGTVGDYRQAIKYSIKSIASLNASTDTVAMMNTYTTISDIYEKLDLPDSALYYQQQAYSLALLSHNEQIIGYAMINFGNIYSKKGNTNLALTYYREAIPYGNTQNDFQSLNEIYLGMARLFSQLGNKDSAIMYTRKALNVATQESFHLECMNATNLLAELYSQAKKPDSAYKYLQYTMAYKDSLFNQEKTKELENLTINERIRQQEIAIEKAKAAEDAIRNLQLLGIAIFIITFLLFVLLISRKKVSPKTIRFSGILALLLLFEFISLFIHPFIEELTHHTPVLMFLILVSIAAILVPTHHKLEEWIKEKLAHKVER